MTANTKVRFFFGIHFHNVAFVVVFRIQLRLVIDRPAYEDVRKKGRTTAGCRFLCAGSPSTPSGVLRWQP